MALYGFSIVGIRQNDPVPGQTAVDHAGAMLDAASDDEAFGKATRIAFKFFGGPRYSFRQAKVWQADLVTTVDSAELMNKT